MELLVLFVGSDYTGVDDSFISLPTFDDKRRTCLTVTITDDDNEEPDEQFTVQFIPDSFNPPNLRVVSNTTNITVVDDDRGM